MPECFGNVLRTRRRQAGKTLGNLANLLGVSVVYLSDVERGNRKPLNKDRILKVAKFLRTDPTQLLEASAHDQGVIEYDIRNAPPLEANVVGGLVTGLARGGISDEQLHEIQRILKETESSDE